MKPLREGDKAYVPMYGWFGYVGKVTGERAGIPASFFYPNATILWFHPAHQALNVRLPETYIERYDWKDGWELWMGKRDERYGGKWFHSSNYWGKYGDNRRSK